MISKTFSFVKSTNFFSQIFSISSKSPILFLILAFLPEVKCKSEKLFSEI